MKPCYEIFLIVLSIAIVGGCATTPMFQRTLWEDTSNTTDTPQIGRLETGETRFDIIATEIKRQSASALLGVSFLCRNVSNHVVVLDDNPFQVIDPNDVIVKPLLPEHATFELTGSSAYRFERARAAEDLMAIGSQPSDSPLEAAVRAFAYGVGKTHRDEIIRERHLQEALPYQFYYQSFSPITLQPGLAVTWTDYYPSTRGSITVFLREKSADMGITFKKPPPPPPTPPKPPPNKTVMFVWVAVGIMAGVMLHQAKQ